MKLGQQDPVGGRFCVAELQSALRKLGYGQAVTGKFGAQTKANVLDFQRRNNIDAIGIVGPKTRRALDNALSVESVIPALPQGSYSLNESCTRYVCSLYLRRSTTSRYAQLLDAHPLATSVAGVILAGACSKVFRINLAGLVCGIVVDRYADDIQDGLRAAASQHACLRLTVRLRPSGLPTAARHRYGQRPSLRRLMPGDQAERWADTLGGCPVAFIAAIHAILFRDASSWLPSSGVREVVHQHPADPPRRQRPRPPH